MDEKMREDEDLQEALDEINLQEALNELEEYQSKHYMDDLFDDNKSVIAPINYFVFLMFFGVGFIRCYESTLPLYPKPSGMLENFINFMGWSHNYDIWLFVIVASMLSIWLYILSKPFDEDGPLSKAQHLSWFFLRSISSFPTKRGFSDSDSDPDIIHLYTKSYVDYCEDKYTAQLRLPKAILVALLYTFCLFFFFYPRQNYVDVNSKESKEKKEEKENARYKSTIVNKYKEKGLPGCNSENFVVFTLNGNQVKTTLDEDTYSKCSIGDTIELDVVESRNDTVIGNNISVWEPDLPDIPDAPDKLVDVYDPMGCYKWSKWSELPKFNTESKVPIKLSDGTRINSIPRFPGGKKSLVRFFRKKMYYDGEKEHQSFGHCLRRDILSCIVHSDGSIKYEEGPDVYDYKSIIRRMPRWKPGCIDGKPADVLIGMDVYSCAYYPMTVEIYVREAKK